MGIENGVGELAQSCLSTRKTATGKTTGSFSGIRQGFFQSIEGMGHSAVSTLRAIEPRILLDAAMIQTADAVLENVSKVHADAYFSQTLNADSDSAQTAPLGQLGDGAGSETGMLVIGVPAISDPLPDTANTTEIVFVDSSVDDLDQLVSQIGSGLEIVVLDANRDGVEQIAEYLSGRSDVDAIHIISHGRPGALDLGNATLNTASIAGDHADELVTFVMH